MRILTILMLSLFLTTSVYAELTLDFIYDLENQDLRLNKDKSKIDDKKYHLIIYKNGISVVNNEFYELRDHFEETEELQAKEGDRLRIEVWGDNGLAFHEEIMAGSNEVKVTKKKIIVPEKPKSVLVTDTAEKKSSFLIGDDEYGDEAVEEEVEIKREMYGYKDEGNTEVGASSYGYKLEDDDKEYKSYGHKNLGYESEDDTYGHTDFGYEGDDRSYGHKTLGYESKDEVYGRSGD